MSILITSNNKPIYNLQTTIQMENQNEAPKPNNHQIEMQKNRENQIDDEDSSSWSLASLEELKSLNLRQLQENEEPMEPQQKQKVHIEVKFPEKPTLLATAPLHQVGRVSFIVGELLIIESPGGAFVVDLDNWLCDEERNLIGFVMDVFGKIERPYYALRPEVITDLSVYAGKDIYYMEGSSKILRDEDIKSMKSKSALEAAEDQDDDSSEQEKIRIDRDFSQQRYERKKSPPRRTNKFREHERIDRQEGSRERTRENMRHNRNASRGRNEQNQRYLTNMYSMHYNQMMRLYNGEFDPFNPPPMQNPYTNQQRPQNVMPHANIAQFGTPNFQNPFYGQVFPTNQQGFPMNQGGQYPNQNPQGSLFQGQPQQQNQHSQQGLFGNNNNNNPFNGRQ